MFLTFLSISFFLRAIYVVFAKDVEDNFGGHKITISQAPYQALILMLLPDYKIRRCGGAIIGSQWLLTASHCTTGASDEKLIKIGAGISGIMEDAGETTHTPEQIIRHKEGDIALIKVKPEFKFSKTVNLIALADSDPPENSVALSSGYGSNRKDVPVLDDLHEVELKIMNRQVCKAHHKIEMTEQHICGSDGGKGMCLVDSGAPLVSTSDKSHKTLIGIASFMSEIDCTNTPHPGVYSSVSYFRNWIKQNSGI